MSGLGKDMSGMVRSSQNEVRAGTFPDSFQVGWVCQLSVYVVGVEVT